MIKKIWGLNYSSSIKLMSDQSPLCYLIHRFEINIQTWAMPLDIKNIALIFKVCSLFVLQNHKSCLCTSEHLAHTCIIHVPIGSPKTQPQNFYFALNPWSNSRFWSFFKETLQFTMNFIRKMGHWLSEVQVQKLNSIMALKNVYSSSEM